MELFHYVMCHLGFVYIITQSAISRPIRMLFSKLGTLATTLIYCPACTGFWVGVFLGIGGLWPFDSILLPNAIESGVAGCALGALWGEYGPSYDVYSAEVGDPTNHDNQEQEKTS